MNRIHVEPHRSFAFPVVGNLVCVALAMFFCVYHIILRPRYCMHEVNLYQPRFMAWEAPSCQYLDVMLTGNVHEDSARIKMVRQFMVGMYAARDTSHGINVRFGDATKYWEFIAVFNIIWEEDIQVYIFTDSGISVLYPSYKRWSNKKAAILL